MIVDNNFVILSSFLIKEEFHNGENKTSGLPSYYTLLLIKQYLNTQTLTEEDINNLITIEKCLKRYTSKLFCL